MVRRAALAVAAMLALCGPAGACDVAAADFRSVFDRTIAPRAGLAPVSEYDCHEGGATVCDMTTPAALDLHAEDAWGRKRVSYVTVSTEQPIGAGAAEAVLLALGALCSPTVPAGERDAALSGAAKAATVNGPGAKVIVGDVSYNVLTFGDGKLGLRIKDRRLPNSAGVNTSDDE